MTEANELNEAVLQAVDSVRSREALLEEIYGPDWNKMIEHVRAGRSCAPADVVFVAKALWGCSEAYRKSAVTLLRLARQHSLGDFDVDVVELNLDKRLREEADNE
jgi:hypothetical protein